MITQIFDQVSQQIGLPDDQVRIVFAWLIAIPLGFINKGINQPTLRNYYNLITGFSLSYICLDYWVFITLFSAIVVYIMLLVLKKKSDWPSFIFLFGLLLSCHTYRYITDFYGWRVDGAISLMMMLCKMIYITFYYCDGRLKEIPNFMEYLGYMYFYPSAVLGPVFEYSIYLEFVNKQGNYKNKYSTIRPALKEMFLAICYLGGLQLLVPIINTDYYFTDEFKESSLLFKIFYTQVVCFVLRFRYFGGWKFGQAGMNASGITYNGDGKYDRIITMKNNFEIEYNARTKTECWNTSVQTWLKNVFYYRFNKAKMSALNALLGVFAISALWHGVHPVYYFGFVYWGFLNELTKCFYKAQHKFKFIPYFVREINCYIFGILFFNNVGIIINLLDMYKVLEVYAMIYYIPLIIPFSILLFFKITGFGQKKQRVQ